VPAGADAFLALGKGRRVPVGPWPVLSRPAGELVGQLDCLPDLPLSLRCVTCERVTARLQCGGIGPLAECGPGVFLGGLGEPDHRPGAAVVATVSATSIMFLPLAGASSEHHSYPYLSAAELAWPGNSDMPHMPESDVTFDTPWAGPGAARVNVMVGPVIPTI